MNIQNPTIDKIANLTANGWVKTTSGDGNLTVDTGVGPQGPQGTQGTQGPQGFQGFQGFQGDQGVQGAQGAKGDQGFQGTQGAQGNQGNQGPQGAQGDQGPANAGGWTSDATRTMTSLWPSLDEGGAYNKQYHSFHKKNYYVADAWSTIFTITVSIGGGQYGMMLCRLVACTGIEQNVGLGTRYVWWNLKEEGGSLATAVIAGWEAFYREAPRVQVAVSGSTFVVQVANQSNVAANGATGTLFMELTVCSPYTNATVS